MKKFKALTAAVMGATLIMSSAIMITAEDIRVDNIKTEITTTSVNDSTISTEATIKSIIKEDNNTNILITPNNEGSMDILLKISDQTKLDLDSLKEGDVILATYEKAMTRSIPPQTNAVEISKVNTSDEELTSAPPTMQKTVRMDAIISEITDGEYKSILVNDANEKNSQVSLNIDNETIIMNVDGTPVNFVDLKAGDKINVVHSPAMTFSLPPQTYSYAIIVNNEQLITSPRYIEVSKTELIDGTTTLESADGDIILRLNEDTEISAFATKNIVKASDIKEKTLLFAWFNIMTLSLPAQATADKVMILPERGADEIATLESTSKMGEAIETVVSKVSIDGKELDLQGKNVEKIENHIMLPVGVIAKELGFDVKWDSTTNTANLDNGLIKTSITVGKDSYFKASSRAIGLTAPVSYGAVPILIDGNLYVPADLFNLLYSNPDTVTISEDTLNIKTK